MRWVVLGFGYSIANIAPSHYSARSYRPEIEFERKFGNLGRLRYFVIFSDASWDRIVVSICSSESLDGSTQKTESEGGSYGPFIPGRLSISPA